MNVDVLDESETQADVDRLARLCRFVMRRMRLHPSTELCVRLIDVEAITELNTRWMDGDGPTDVLAFPMDELRPGDTETRSPDVSGGPLGPVRSEDETPYLGDIALSPHVAATQASTGGHSAEDEVDLLLVHGVLHLLGFDHAEPEEHARMFGLQSRLLTEWHGDTGPDTGPDD